MLKPSGKRMLKLDHISEQLPLVWQTIFNILLLITYSVESTICFCILFNKSDVHILQADLLAMFGFPLGGTWRQLVSLTRVE